MSFSESMSFVLHKMPDHRLWFPTLLGLFPLYIHNTAYSLLHSSFALHIQPCHLVQIAPPSFPEGRYPTHPSSYRFDHSPHTTRRCQQNLPLYSWSGHY